jgi:hypothetical protein
MNVSMMLNSIISKIITGIAGKKYDDTTISEQHPGTDKIN